MLIKTFATCLLIALGWLYIPASYAQEDGMGQIIHIQTYLKSFTGKPSWLLIIRDLDHNQNIPYVYDFKKNNNYWAAFTYGRNYLIIASQLQFAPYGKNPYQLRVINNFCGLESQGRIIRGESISITITGKLTPYYTFNCRVLKYPDARFSIESPASQ